MTKKKEKKLSYYKKAAWDAFSRFIRTRDCLFTTGDPEWGKCVTCKKMKPYKQLQSGHFIPGRGGAVLFEEKGVHAQCAACNNKQWGNGKPVEYMEFMLEKYGQEEVWRQYAEAKGIRKYTRLDYIAIKEHYDDLYKKLLLTQYEN